MTTEQPILRPNQCRAARVLLHISRKTLGVKSGLRTKAVDAFEKNRLELDAAQQTRLREILEALGAEFIPEDDQQGYGVRRRYNSQQITSLTRWEGEGGPSL